MAPLELLAEFTMKALTYWAGATRRSAQSVARSCFAFAVVGAVLGLISIPIVPKPQLEGSNAWLALIAVGSVGCGLVGVVLARRPATRPRRFVYGALLAFCLLLVRFVYETSGKS
jgi:hypothetical protein